MVIFFISGIVTEEYGENQTNNNQSTESAGGSIIMSLSIG